MNWPELAIGEASREDQDTEQRQSFPMVGENSQSRESRPLAPVQEIRSRGFQFAEQTIVRQI